jgi:hypothetical protein
MICYVIWFFTNTLNINMLIINENKFTPNKYKNTETWL